MFWKRRNDHLTDDDLSAYLDGQMPAARREAASRHLESCSQCSRAVAELGEVAALVSRLPRVEAPRSFALTPQMAGVESRLPALRRTPFAFAPVAALTLLVALFAVDLASSGSSSRDELASGGQEAMVARDAGSGAGTLAESGERATSSAFSDSAGQASPVAPPATGPAAGQAAPTPAIAAAPMTPETATNQPQPSAESAGDSTEKGGDADSSRSADGSSGGGGTDWLRIGQALAAIAFIVSLAFVFGPGLLRKERSS